MADGNNIQRNIAGVIMHDIALNIANVNLAIVDMGLLKTTLVTATDLKLLFKILTFVFPNSDQNLELWIYNIAIYLLTDNSPILFYWL